MKALLKTRNEAGHQWRDVCWCILGLIASMAGMALVVVPLIMGLHRLAGSDKYLNPEQRVEFCIEVQTDRWDDTHELVRTSDLRRQINYQIARCHKGGLR